MLFSPEPKSKREDLYDREKELEELNTFLRGNLGPMALLLGLRRTGKTSLLKVSLSEFKGPTITIDMRKIEEKGAISYRDFIKLLQEGINNITKSWKSTIIEALKRVRGVEVSGFKVYLAWGGKNKATLTDLLDKLNDAASEAGTKIVIAIDEAQELIKATGFKVDVALAYAYDNLKSIKFILTGSRIGLLYRLIGIDNPKAPLFGRAMWEVKLSYFNRDQSIDFLIKGFEELNIKANMDEIEEAVEELNGIPGWLSLYGYYRIKKQHKEALNEVKQTAEAMIISEAENFLKIRPQARARYIEILKAIASGCDKWSTIKRKAESALGEPIPPKNYTEMLNNLVAAGLIEKKDDRYEVPDKLMKNAYMKLKA